MDAPKVFACFDVGSNGVRLFVGRLFRGGVQILEDRREAIRLGEDTFRRRTISERSLLRLIHCFDDFRRRALSHGALHWRAVATSALRDAHNRDHVVSEVWRRTGVRIEVIDGIEEAHLLHRAVSQTVPLGRHHSLLIDIGGGSVEAVLTKGARLKEALTLPIGTVRLLERCGVDSPYTSYANPIRRELTRLMESCDPYEDLIRPDLLVGTGGNVRAFSRLVSRLHHGRAKPFVTVNEMEHLSELIFKYSVRQRQTHLGLKRDRADVIRPATVVVLEVMRAFNFSQLLVPNVGIKNGVFWTLAEAIALKGQTGIRSRGPQISQGFRHDRSGPDL